MKMEKK